MERIHVDGRNGDLVRDTGAYSNVDMKYQIYFNGQSSSFQEVAINVAFWLNGSTGYNRLEDSYDPDIFRQAMMTSYTEYRNWQNAFGRAEVVFSCKPQRFFKSGEVEISATPTLQNDWMPCHPLLVVTGNGVIRIGDSTIVVSNNAGNTLNIDTETENAYSGDIANPKTQTLTGEVTIPRANSYTLPLNFDANESGEIYLTFDLEAAGNVFSSHYDFEIDPSTAWSYSEVLWNNTTIMTATKDAEVNEITFATGTSFGSPQITITNLVVRTLKNRNADIAVTGGFPILPTGGTSCSFTTDSLSLYPRWWTL